jgi:catechol 2,3-dioxygenase-like lactoylglutathione lyase family enzyme
MSRTTLRDEPSGDPLRHIQMGVTEMIKVRDIAYVRFRAPDLETMEKFAADFGLALAAREGDTLYHRGTDPSPYCHVTELGEPAFLGAGFEAASADDLQAASRLEGASPVGKIDAPGGGQRVRFTDPDGFVIDVVHGRELLPALPVPTDIGVNRGSDRRRVGKVHRPPAGPSSVKRLGHTVLKVSDFRTSAAWYKSRFGFLSSDEFYLGEKDNVIGAFMRCDLGEEFSDHHTLVCLGTGEPGLEHIAFEVEDIDALMAGHDHLESAGYGHQMGIGRHILGSQIFDYWRDPWGHVLEHFTDGDLLNDANETGLHDPGTVLGTLWGKMVPPV